MKRSSRRRNRCRPHPQLHLPPLEAEQALILVHICERLIAAIWRAHGDAMAEILGDRHSNHLVSQTTDSSSVLDIF